MSAKLPPDPGWMGDRKRGASMGRVDTIPRKGQLVAPRFRLRRIRVNQGGYDSGGAYWGLGTPLWRAEDRTYTAIYYFRSTNRDAAKVHVLALHPDARFFR